MSKATASKEERQLEKAGKSSGKMLLTLFLFPLFHEELVVSEFEAHFNEDALRALKREHAILSQILRNVNQKFAILPSEQATPSFTTIRGKRAKKRGKDC